MRDYTTLTVTLDGGVAWAVLDHPPINLLDLAMIADLDRLTTWAEADDEVRVLVVASANPEFFIAHADVGVLIAMAEAGVDTTTALAGFHAMTERLRAMPKLTVAVVEGIARGGGCEVMSSFDVRYASPSARFAQPEVALGIIPGGSGTQRLPRLVGRGRALEAILGCADIDAAEAERWGLVNRVMPTGDVEPAARRLAERVASFPAPAVAAAKRAVDAALGPVATGLEAEAVAFGDALATGEARQAMASFLAGGGQTRDGEIDLGWFTGW